MTRTVQVTEPYTHNTHARRCHEAGTQSVILRQFVQAKLGHTVFCGRIVEAWDTADGVEMWKLQLLQPQGGVASLSAQKVRQCSGLDGHCACAGEKPDRASEAPREAGFFAGSPAVGFSQAGVVAPPESLTHETSPVSAG